jgi:hypothetical protein
MVYMDKYIHIYKFKYIYVHIRVRQQLEYTLKSKKREMRPFSLGWYYQPRLKGVGAGAGVSRSLVRFVIPPGTKETFSPGWFNRD